MAKSSEAGPSNQEVKKSRIFPNVPEKFTGGYPKGYRPWPEGWSFSVEKMKEKLPDGTYKMLTLDISISSQEFAQKINSAEDPKERADAIEKLYPCPNRCKFCFERQVKSEDSDNFLLSWEENKQILDQAKELGLETAKFLGPGELLDDPDLFKYLDYFQKKGITFSIFTKPAFLMDKGRTQERFGLTPQEFFAKIASYKNVNLLVSFTSADPETEAKMVETGVEDYFNRRNGAIEILAGLGMNDDPNNQRLTLICAPILRKNIDEAFEIFKWGIKRNIPVVLAPTMVSGCGGGQEEIRDAAFKDESLVDLYTDIYNWLIREGILTLGQVEQEGVSPYAGFVCNQFISGLFIRKNGQVQACPGNESNKFRYNRDISVDREIKPGRVEEVWKNSMSYGMRRELIETGKISLTQPCYAKTEGLIKKKGEAQIAKGSGAFSENFYELVLEKVREKQRLDK